MNKDILRIEEMGLNGWPPVSTNIYNGAVLRFAQGYTKRANSCNPLYCSNRESVIDYSEEFYQRKNLPVIFKIVSDITYVELDSNLEEKGYSKVDLTNVMIMDLSSNDFISKHKVNYELSITDNWIEDFLNIYKRTQNRELVTTMLNSIEQKVVTGTIEKDGKVVACGYSVIEDEWVGFFDIYVGDEYRGKGLGRSMMSGLISKSKELGAKKSYIQVVANNNPAVTLYKSLGYKEFYNYWYRVKK